MVSLPIVNGGNGYETRQSSLLYVIVLFFGLDPAQNTIVVYPVPRGGGVLPNMERVGYVTHA